MRTSTLLFAAAFIYTATALPFASSTKSSESSLSTGGSKPYDWSAGYASEFSIHSSCNATERRQLEFALEETVELAKHAKEHIHVQGNNSEIYQKYFGSGPTAPVIGWLEKVASGNRQGIVFRCDDPDKNCETQDAWAGHHRGSNATMETVICSLSYTTRWPLSQMCAHGFQIATGKLATYWAADLMHRLFHVPVIGEGESGVGHHADSYKEMLELAKGENVTLAGMNSASIYYFAVEAYAFDIAVPGDGCVGKPIEEEHDHDDDDAAASTSTPAAATSTTAAKTTAVETSAVAASTTAEAVPEATEAAPEEDCHTHDDGVVHCT